MGDGVAADVLEEAAALADRLGRDDIGTRLRAGAIRARRPSTVVCVVGEFKQGKSTLVNTLVGESVCPVDDDLATSVITVVRHGTERTAVAHRRGATGREQAAIPLDQIPRFASEVGNPDNRLGVDRLEVTVPSGLLRTGISIIDTPGAGGMGGAQRATLAFLPMADALLFVSDSSAELSAPEVEFLRRAVDACPSVVLVLTKIDLHPEWRRIAELDEGHLARAGVDIPIVAVSSHLRQRAVLTGDGALNRESGFLALGAQLERTVLDPARSAARRRAVAEGQAAIEQQLAICRAEAELADPEQAGAAVADLERAKTELEHLRGPAARWTVLLGDRVSNLAAEVTHDLKAALRDAGRMIDERAEDVSTAAALEELAADVQGSVVDAVGAVQLRLQEGLVETQRAVIELLRDEAPNLPGLSGFAPEADIGRFWADFGDAGTRFAGARKVVSGVNQVADTLRGASGGVMVLGMLHTVLPIVSTTFLMSTPFTIGLGVWFGGRTFLDARKRRIATERQQARTAVRKALDDIGFEVGDQVTTSLRLAQQQLRDQFTDRFVELQRSTAALLQEAQDSAQRSESARRQRATELADLMSQLTSVGDRLRAANDELVGS